MDFELTASMMCANYGNLEKEVRDLEEAVSILFILTLCGCLTHQ